MDISLAKRGVLYLLRGESGRVREYLERRVGNVLEPRVSDFFTSTVQDTSEIPDWIRTSNSVTVSRIDDYGFAEYFVSFRGNHDDSKLEIDPPNEFDEIRLNALDTKFTKEFIVLCEFRLSDGSVSEKRQRYSGDLVGRARGSEPRSIVPIRFSTDRPATRAVVSFESVQQGDVDDGTLDHLSKRLATSVSSRGMRNVNWKTSNDVWFTLPSIRRTDPTNPNLFLLSIDTLRFDYLARFDRLVEAFGDNAVVPQEPRTQGFWTRPSLASTLTGVHPCHHGYNHDNANGFINPGTPLISEFLADHAYTCSGINTRGSFAARGFSRGFHRFHEAQMTYNKRDYDASFVVNQLCDWIDRDARGQTGENFYFAHIYDPHYPYLPPDGYRDGMETDGANTDPMHRIYGSQGGDYLEGLRSDPQQIDEEAAAQIRDMYVRSIEYVIDQVERLIAHMKRRDQFEDSLVILTGDHGESILDYGFFGHTNLFDTNIRPGMIVKPPGDASFTPPDKADLIDIYPTVAKMIGADVPDHCEGTAWHRDVDDMRTAERPRITEGVIRDWYSIAVERRGTKAIYTYDHCSRGRPNPEQIADGPEDNRFYTLSDPAERVGEDPIDESDVDPKLRRQLRDDAETFVREMATDPRVEGDRRDYESQELDEEVEKQLEELGYS